MVGKNLFGKRPVSMPGDMALLLAIFRSTREPELSLIGWSDEEIDAFVRLQFAAQLRDYNERYPEAEHSLVVAGARPAGRLFVARTEVAVHIVDISLLPSFRGAGLGRSLVQELFDEADARAVPVTCYVEARNEARLFWQRLGFVAQSAEGAYIALERPCAISRR
jgi:ribosomal protein S18 acetylase RimI-like enzyme